MDINQVYRAGLATVGTHEKAVEFTVGFMKQASAAGAGAEAALGAGKIFGKSLLENAGKALASGVGGAAIGLGLHGMSSLLASSGNASLRAKFETALKQAIATSPILQEAEPNKVRSFAETVFKFAPRVAGDPNILGNVLDNAINGASMDLATMKALGELESRYVDTSKSSMFSPKAYV
jgi:hypothetical protein